MKDLKTWEFVKENLSKDNPVILTIVLESKGSSPGKAGFKIAVAKNGKFEGTVGGGEMEFKLIEESKKYLSSNKKITALDKLYHNKKVRKLQSGLICAGNQTNFTCSLNKSDLRTIDKIVRSYQTHKEGFLVITPKGIVYLKECNGEQNIKFSFNSSSDWRYEERIGIREKIYIVGGGHVGLALSRQMKLLNFYVVVFDDRRNVKTVKENIYADKIKICSFDEVGNFIDKGENSYVAVVTASYPTDLLAIKSIIDKKMKYIGLMGSSTKLKKIFDELKMNGIKTGLLKTINAPIGIEVNSESVEEIAVSIAAEIIKVKNSY